MRKAHKEEIIAYYHQQLIACLRALGVDANETNSVSMQDLHKSYDAVAPITLNGALLAVPFACSWNKDNMDENDREILFSNLDDLLDKTIQQYEL